MNITHKHMINFIVRVFLGSHHHHRVLALFAIIILVMFTFPSELAQTSAEQTTFAFNKFSPGMSDIIFEGDAMALEPVIELTKSRDDLSSTFSVGRATYCKPIHLWDNYTGKLADFSTYFSFAINSMGKNTKGNGFAFFLSNNGSKLELSSEGISLGLSSEAQIPFVAVEFDTWNSGYPDPDDSNEHIGIDVNSLHSVNYTNWDENDIVNGGRIETWIAYNSGSKILSVSVTNGYSRSYTRKYEYNLHYVVDFQKYLSEWVTIGFSASTQVNLFEKHEIYYWEFNSTLQLDENLANHTLATPPTRRRSKVWLWALLGSTGTLVVILGLFSFCYCMKKRRKQTDRIAYTDYDFERGTGPRSFSYEELVIATDDFASERLLGRGGFGSVYVGMLSDTNSRIAVKKLASDSQPGLKEYESEVKAISRLRHRNLVQLIGWCRKKQQAIILYEFMPNKSLDFHLFNKTGLLTWERRYNIALGLGSALHYLQEECEKCVLHRDIKSSNVLLDSNFNSKLGDFGLARLVEHGKGTDTTRLIGTDGYIAPEYLESGKATKESDVYSFGIVALELASGRPAFKEVDGKYGMKCKVKFVDWVWEQYGKGNIFAVADPQLHQNYVQEEMERLIVVGLGCAHPNWFHRLSVRDALDMLNAKAPLPVLPSEMPLLANIASSQANVCASFGSSSLSGGGSGGSGTGQL